MLFFGRKKKHYNEDKKYKVVWIYPDGSSVEDDEVFDSEEDAEAYALDGCSSYSAGAEIMNLSNPGDYPLDEDDYLDYEIIEVDD